MSYLIYFLISIILGIFFTFIVKKIAVKFKILDFPNISRKLHSKPTPLLGGLAVFLAFLIPLTIYLFIATPDFNIVPLKFFLAIIFGGVILIVGGTLDDKFNLPPKFSWLFPAVASLIVVGSGIGIGIKEISNPFGAPFSLDYIIFTIPVSAITMWIWMMGMIYTTKFLDGLDGLCAGISLIGGLTLFALSLTDKINQPITATIAIIFAGALLGYLFFGFNPAKIFLGESGSTFTGFILGILAIILGAKIATTLLVMGVPILDVAWVIITRLWNKKSPFRGDRKHLHFRFLDIGLTQRQIIFILYGISISFGALAVFLESLGKVIALVILLFIMIGATVYVVSMYKKQQPKLPGIDE